MRQSFLFLIFITYILLTKDKTKISIYNLYSRCTTMPHSLLSFFFLVSVTKNITPNFTSVVQNFLPASSDFQILTIIQNAIGQDYVLPFIHCSSSNSNVLFLLLCYLSSVFSLSLFFCYFCFFMLLKRISVPKLSASRENIALCAKLVDNVKVNVIKAIKK